MKLLHVLSPTAAAGKTVFAVGLVRVLRADGWRPAVFKPVGETNDPVQIGLAAQHLAAAAGMKPRPAINPLLVVPTGVARAELWLRGKRIGVVPRLGRDAVVLNDLTVELRREIDAVVLASLAEVAHGSDVVVSEGAGGVSDLSLIGAWDLANVQFATLARAAILVARYSRGGALAGIAGATRLVPSEVRRKLLGFVLNDVRTRQAETKVAARVLAQELDLTFLGAVPGLPWFEGRPSAPPLSTASDEDHSVLARAVRDNIDMPAIVSALEGADVP